MTLLEATGYRCTRAAASLGAWDIIGIGSTDVVLVQVKTRDWPGSAEMETLTLFPCPPHCRKLVHRWRDLQRMPDVKEMVAFLDKLWTETFVIHPRVNGSELELEERTR